MTMDNRIEPSRFKGGGGGGGGGVECVVAAATTIFEPLSISSNGKEEEQNCCSSSSTSSIGRNSDLSERSSDGDDSEENEVQSSYNGPLVMMNSLEEVLPMRRGISNFYNGKSKSFTSLAEATSASSIKDITKQENAYNRRRRNLLAINHIWDRNRSSKRPITSSRSTLALAVAMSNSSESISSGSDDSVSRSPPRLPPLHPQSRGGGGCFSNITDSPPPPYTRQQNNSFSPWRSFSVVDLQQCAMTNVTKIPFCSSLVSAKTEQKYLT